MKVVKNKVAPPFRKAEFDIMFGEGISRSGEILDLAVELGFVKKSGAWFSYEGKKLGQGRDAVKRVIQDNPELMEELDKKVREHLKAVAANPSDSANPFLPGKKTERVKADDEDQDDSADDMDFGDDSAGDMADDLFADDFDIEG